MEVPSEVLVHNQLVGLKGNAGRLLGISDQGYYELNLSFGSNVHRVLLPIAGTALIAQEAEPPSVEGVEIEP